MSDVSVQKVFDGRLIQLNIETIQLPNGAIATLEIAHHPGGAAVLAVDAQSRVCLLRQYRHAAGGWLWELPAGKLEPNEPPLETARRELEEEAGVVATDWESLSSIITTPGFCDEVIHLFLARDLTQTHARPETHEAIEVHWFTRQEVTDMLATATIRDAKTLVGLYRGLSRITP